MWHSWERREMHVEFWLESPNERDPLEEAGIDGK